MPKDEEPKDPEALVRVPIPFSPALLAEVDDFRFATRQPSRAEAIRVLLREALDARTTKPPAAS